MVGPCYYGLKIVRITQIVLMISGLHPFNCLSVMPDLSGNVGNILDARKDGVVPGSSTLDLESNLSTNKAAVA